MQYMAELPGIYHEIKELNHQNPYDLNHNLESNNGIGKPQTGPYPSLELSTSDYRDSDFLDNMQPVDSIYHLTLPPSPHYITQCPLFYKVQNLRNALCTLGNHLNIKLTNGSTAYESPSNEAGSPIPTTYHFTNWRDMTAYNCFWSILILTNKVLLRLLPPFDPTSYELHSECRALALEICKTWENAWASKPIGAFHTGLSFVVAYEFCDPEVQEWIIGRLNSLLDFQGIDAFRWDGEVIRMMAGKLAGEGPDLSFELKNLAAGAR